MTYELAKQLKEAGFPQEVKNGEWFVPGIANPEVYMPTLSELIEAMPCRKKYLGIINDAHFVLRKLVSREEEYWAYYEDEDTDKPVDGYSFRNMPAEEAVARLWLKLQ
uniref:Uncharacterized protein n=1 Tax=viral metagenome TaxID=1070528 RepID=A0A6M3J888_9ZZZZ